MVCILDVTGNLKIENRVRCFCLLPYPNHPKGCPNYGKYDHCPPDAPMVDDFIDLNKQHWFAIQQFNIEYWANEMHSKHPNWTELQCRNSRLWQNKVKSTLRKGCEEFMGNYNGLIYTLLPEAMGVNVFRTLIPLGFKIKVRPTVMIYKVALIGYNVKESSLEGWL